MLSSRYNELEFDKGGYFCEKENVYFHYTANDYCNSDLFMGVR